MQCAFHYGRPSRLTLQLEKEQCYNSLSTVSRDLLAGLCRQLILTDTTIGAWDSSPPTCRWEAWGWERKSACLGSTADKSHAGLPLAIAWYESLSAFSPTYLWEAGTEAPDPQGHIICTDFYKSSGWMSRSLIPILIYSLSSPSYHYEPWVFILESKTFHFHSGCSSLGSPE